MWRCVQFLVTHSVHSGTDEKQEAATSIKHRWSVNGLSMWHQGSQNWVKVMGNFLHCIILHSTTSSSPDKGLGLSLQEWGEAGRCASWPRIHADTDLRAAALRTSMGSREKTNSTWNDHPPRLGYHKYRLEVKNLERHISSQLFHVKSTKGSRGETTTDVPRYLSK